MPLFQRDPYMSVARRLKGRDSSILDGATYQILPGDRGLPVAQLELQFNRWKFPNPTFNPEMSLCVLLDKSGSMSETFSDGHAFNACAAVLDEVQYSGNGFDLVFYDTAPRFHGRVKDRDDLRRAIDANRPGGGTAVTGALRGAVKHYRKKRGLYLIVITDGEFSDKQEAEQYVVKELLPQVKPDNPYAIRLHFIGAGGEVDREFLEHLEEVAAGQGVPLVAAHHHEHLSHAHASMVQEMERALVGVSNHAIFGERVLVEARACLLYTSPSPRD